MKILIVDDHPLFLVGLRHILDDIPEPITALEASDFDSAFALIAEHSDINWICLDLQMPSGTGFEFLRELEKRRITLPVAILTADEDPISIDKALRAGAIAYLSKSSPKAELIESFGIISNGSVHVSKALREPLRRYRAGPSPRVKLTRRQREVLSLVVSGHSNNAIADQLRLAESTVKGHVSALYDLLGVENRAACTSRALKLRLID